MLHVWARTNIEPTTWCRLAAKLDLARHPEACGAVCLAVQVQSTLHVAANGLFRFRAANQLAEAASMHHLAMRRRSQVRKCARQLNVIGLQPKPGTQPFGHVKQDCPTCSDATEHVGAATKKTLAINAGCTRVVSSHCTAARRSRQSVDAAEDIEQRNRTARSHA